MNPPQKVVSDRSEKVTSFFDQSEKSTSFFFDQSEKSIVLGYNFRFPDVQDRDSKNAKTGNGRKNVPSVEEARRLARVLG